MQQPSWSSSSMWRGWQGRAMTWLHTRVGCTQSRSGILHLSFPPPVSRNCSPLGQNALLQERLSALRSSPVVVWFHGEWQKLLGPAVWITPCGDFLQPIFQIGGIGELGSVPTHSNCTFCIRFCSFLMFPHVSSPFST